MSRGDDPKQAQVRIQNRKEPPRTCTLIFSPAEPLRELSYHSPVLQWFAFQGLIGQNRLKPQIYVGLTWCHHSEMLRVWLWISSSARDALVALNCEAFTHWPLQGTSQRLNVAPGAQRLLLPNAKQLNRTEPLRFSTLIICRILSDLDYQWLSYIHTYMCMETILVILCNLVYSTAM